MRHGVVISGSAHALLVLAVIIGLPDTQDDARIEPSRVTNISIVELQDFQASQSTAPSTIETPQLALNAPSTEANEATTPETEVPPQAIDVPKPNTPETGEAPDLSALESIAPEISTNVEAPLGEQDASPLGSDTPLPDAPTQDGSINSNNVAVLAPQTPNLAPRIDTSAAAKPPKPTPIAPEVVPENAPAPNPEPKPEPEPAKPAAAPQEATTEVTPESVEQDNPTSPRAASRPKGRPANLQAENERKKKEAEAIEAALAAAAEKPEEDEPTETNEIATAPVPAPEPNPKPAETGSRLGQDFNSSEAQAIGDVIGKSWNKTLIEGKDQYERLVVIVRVKMKSNGKVIGAVEPVQPRSPNGDFKVAFEAARRAVLRAQPIPLPTDKFRDGDFLEIRFDPGRSTISLD